jgi:hypothetical protein
MAKLTTAVCKKAIVEELVHTECILLEQNIPNCTPDKDILYNVKNWKRLSKRKQGNDTVRVFECKGHEGAYIEVTSDSDDEIVKISAANDSTSDSTNEYRFWVSSDDEECDFGDYSIFIMDQNDYDNIGSHIPEVDAVMSPLGIHGEEMENFFVGSFSDKIKTNQDVIDYLESKDWTEDPKLNYKEE